MQQQKLRNLIVLKFERAPPTDFNERALEMEARRTGSGEGMASSEQEEEGFVPYTSAKTRKLQRLEQLQSRRKRPVRREAEEMEKRKLQEGEEEELRKERKRKHVSLIDQAAELKIKELESGKTAEEIQLEDEEALLKALAERKKLQSDYELAKGIIYTEAMKTSWNPPSYIKDLTHGDMEEIRKKNHIIATGLQIPAPITTFREMKLPKPLVAYLKSKNIVRPSSIQMQGIPVALSGRDMIGISFTGSGKTLVFALPSFLFALEAECQLPLVRGEGPISLIISPSRELARQTYENVIGFAEEMAKNGFPPLRVMLCIGGISLADQLSMLNRGIHIVVATPGRLQDMLEKKKFNLDSCRILCLDEADRMVDLGFEEDVRNIMSYFKNQRQTLLFSATMPRKIQDFAQSALVMPVTVNVGRAGAASLDIIQEVEYVKQEAKMVYLLECLQKTPPPVLIFAENKNDVDDIQEYLLIKGVEVVAIHGQKDQAEREYAIRSFKNYKKDVLVATDVASKGLDFPDIKHVINYDMPKEIEDYGRSGKTGIATTFINKNSSEQILLDLKHLLLEAKQKIPPVLLALHDPNEGSGRGCAYCGGLGHRIQDCPKLNSQTTKQMGSMMGRNDAGGGGY